MEGGLTIFRRMAEGPHARARAAFVETPRTNRDSRLARVVPVAAGVAAALCGTASVSAQEPVTVRDSAGIHIVENHAPVWAPSTAWSLGPEPLLDLSASGEGPDHEFGIVLDAIRLRDGSIAVADLGRGSVRVYRSDGRFLRSIGRQGDGPGAFRSLSGFGLAGRDTLLVYDAFVHRISRFLVDGEHLGTIPVDRHGAPGLSPALFVEGLGLVGMPIPSSVNVDYSNQGLRRARETLLAFDLRGALIDTVAIVPGLELFVTPRAFGPVPFGRTFELASGDGRLVTTDTEGMVFDIWEGRPLRRSASIRVPGYDLSLDPARLIEEFQEQYASDTMTVYDQALWEAIRDRRTRPSASGLLLDTRGNLWVAAPTGASDDPAHYEVFDAGGRWLGRVPMPARTRLLFVDGEVAITRYRDAEGAETVRVYRIGR